MILDQTYILKLYYPFMPMTQNAAELYEVNKTETYCNKTYPPYIDGVRPGVWSSTLRNVNISASRTKERDWKPLTALEPSASIPLSSKEKDVGVLISHNLSWHNHIMAKVNTANKVLRLIKRTCGTCTQPHVLLKLYIHLVRPHVEFASQVWSPHQQFSIYLIERVQRRAIKLSRETSGTESSLLGLKEALYGLSFPF